MPAAAVLLVGLGLNELSMAPASIPSVKERLREVTLSQARGMAKEACEIEE